MASFTEQIQQLSDETKQEIKNIKKTSISLPILYKIYARTMVISVGRRA